MLCSSHSSILPETPMTHSSLAIQKMPRWKTKSIGIVFEQSTRKVAMAVLAMTVNGQTRKLPKIF